MRRSIRYVAWCALLSGFSGAWPCGGDPCERAGYAGAIEIAPLMRPNDWRSVRLDHLIGVYYGAAAARAATPEGPPASPPTSRADYLAAVARLFSELGLPAPELPESSAPPGWWDGLCRSNDYAAATRFLAAIAEQRELAGHAARLIGWRTRMIGICLAHREPLERLRAELEQAIATEPALRDVAGYLLAAASFYAGESDAASARFAQLAKASNRWVREAASYMHARALLVAAQRDWDGYSDRGAVDRSRLAEARDALAAYRAAHPTGAYAGSAQGLERRAAHLAGDRAQFNRLTIARFAALHAARDFAEIGRTAASEITNFLDLRELTLDGFPFDEPLLAATLAPHTPALADAPGAALEKLLPARARYEPFPGLYLLLSTPLWARAGRIDEALQAEIPAATPPAIRNAIAYERALALGTAGRHAEARAALRALSGASPGLVFDDAFVAELFRQHLADGTFDDAFAPGSPLNEAAIARDLFERFPSETTLRALAADRGGVTSGATSGAGAEAAAQELLFRLLRERRFSDFITLYEQAERPAPFEAVETAARSLTRNASDPKGLFNVGYFLQVHNGAPGPCCPCNRFAQPMPAPIDSLASPLALYIDALAKLASGGDPDLEAKVLHHAILCFKQSSDAYACQRGRAIEVAETTRASWFRRLKTKYRGTAWAERTPYYY